MPSKLEAQNSDTSLAWRPTLVIPALERQTQDLEGWLSLPAELALDVGLVGKVVAVPTSGPEYRTLGSVENYQGRHWISVCLLHADAHMHTHENTYITHTH